MKKLLLLLLTVTLILTFVGCGKEKTSSSNDAKTDAAVKATKETQDEKESQEKNKETEDNSDKESAQDDSQATEKNIITVAYKGSSTFQTKFDPTNIEIDAAALSSVQKEINLTYKTDTNRHTYTFKVDSENYKSKTEFIDKNLSDCRKMFPGATNEGMTEIQCENIRFTVCTFKYTDKTKKLVYAPLYFAEIEPGSYIYINLGDTIQYNKLDQKMLDVNKKMIEELFSNFILEK